MWPPFGAQSAEEEGTSLPRPREEEGDGLGDDREGRREAVQHSHGEGDGEAEERGLFGGRVYLLCGLLVHQSDSRDGPQWRNRGEIIPNGAWVAARRRGNHDCPPFLPLLTDLIPFGRLLAWCCGGAPRSHPGDLHHASWYVHPSLSFANPFPL